MLLGGVTSVYVFVAGSNSKIVVGPWNRGLSAAKRTLPLGSTAPGASSQPNPLGMVGPAVHVLVEGL